MRDRLWISALVSVSLLRSLAASYGAGKLSARLLYTSDAAAENSGVDLGGLRIIKKTTLVSYSIHSLKTNKNS
ncbi:hypothetical protein [Bradyrhizobium japonicum]|uniref:hypothetical protein n=1 Tax=Bradyrhizobium japonicum TaxID=375 RepID=UPI00117CA519|nr:hypothetical protein [Bradyrhizobium japonicum]